MDAVCILSEAASIYRRKENCELLRELHAACH